MTKLKLRPMPSLLLALLMVVTMLPMTALAAETTDEPKICTDENCSHDHEHETVNVYEIQSDVEAIEPSVTNTENSPVEETPITETSEASKAPDGVSNYSGHIGESAVEWAFDPSSGQLTITGSGYVEPFYSSDEQPWHEVREQITSVRFELSAALEIYDLCYWFDDCANISDVAVPVYVSQICPSDFAKCDALRHLTYGGVDVLAEITADYSNQTGIEPMHEEVANNGIMLLSFSNCGVQRCTCTGSCQWVGQNYRVAPESNDYHIMTVYCNNCGKTDGVIVSGNHSYSSNGYCSLCGYYNSAYDQTAVCYHNSTYRSWSGCSWTEYCSNCGAYISSGTSHGSTYTTWSGCNWYDYCSDCGQLMDSGTSHSYSYGGWEYYNSSRHRRTGTCTSCGATTYSYGYHSTGTKYSPYSSTQHSYGQYCSTCSSYVGSVSYASHSFSYGSWQNYSGTQHRRLKTCSTCGYSEYEYSGHSLSYGAWSNYTASQHRRTVSCSTCGYSSYEYASHSLTAGSWSSISATQHQRTLSCSCGYSTTETAAHTLTYGSWQNYSETQHRRTVSCSVCGYSIYEYANHSITNGAWASVSDTQHQRTNTCSCGYSKTETGTHADIDDDGYCDDCEYLMTHFSVTVPASLSLVVSKNGEVYSANNAAIINNSTGAVEVTAVEITTVNGWTLAPYSTNMANAKVDTKLIGFVLNGAATENSAGFENLTVPGDWTIAKDDSLPLTYDAVVSAISEPVSEQVLTIVFVLNWAVR